MFIYFSNGNGSALENSLDSGRMQCLVFFVISTPTSIFHLAVY